MKFSIEIGAGVDLDNDTFIVSDFTFWKTKRHDKRFPPPPIHPVRLSRNDDKRRVYSTFNFYLVAYLCTLSLHAAV